MPYSATKIRQKLETTQAWLERGVLAIYNDGGSSETDTDYLSYVARWIQSGKKLNGKHLRRVRALMMKYAGQLAEITNAQGKPVEPSKEEMGQCLNSDV